MNDIAEVINKKFELLISKNRKSCQNLTPLYLLEDLTDTTKNVKGSLLSAQLSEPGNGVKIFAGELNDQDVIVKIFRLNIQERTYTSFVPRKLKVVIADSQPQLSQYAIDYLVQFNKSEGVNDILTSGTSYYTFPVADCYLINDKVIPIKTKPYKPYTIPKGGYFCLLQHFTEYVLGMIASYLLEEQICANFTRVYDYESCISEDKTRVNDFIIMEQCDLAILSMGRCLDKFSNNKQDILDNIFIQILFAIACLQKLKIVHNDLHSGNIMLRLTGKDDAPVMFKGRKLNDAKYFRYRLGNGKDIIIRNIGFIVKIIDWDYAVKWSEPMVMNKKASDNIDDKIHIPHWYSTEYDMLTVAHWMHRKFQYQAAEKIMRLCLGDYPLEKYEGMYYRPMLQNLKPEGHGLTPADILLDKNIFGKYQMTMKEDNYVNVATIGDTTD